MKNKFKCLITFIIIMQLILVFCLPTSFAFNSEDNIELTDNGKINLVENNNLEPVKITNKFTGNEETNASQKTKNNDQELTVAEVSDNTYEGTLIKGKTRKTDTYINKAGKHYAYNYEMNNTTSISIMRYCFDNQEYTEIYNSADELELDSVQAQFVEDTVIYFAGYNLSKTNELVVIGYDTQTETITYNNAFSISKDNFQDNFCLDENQNIYILLKGEYAEQLTISTYDENGGFIDSITNNFIEEYDSINLTNVVNGKLFYTAKMIQGGYYWNDDYIINVNNGQFEDKQVYCISQHVGMKLKFLNDSKTVAYDQYGEFFNINYNANNDTGLDMSLMYILNLSSDNYYYYTGYQYSSDSKYVYMGGEQGYVTIFNWNNFNPERIVSIGEDRTVVGVYKNNDKIFMEYYEGNATSKIYAISMDYSEFTKPASTIELTKHTALNRTKQEIKQKYEDLDIVNKNNFDDVYDIVPSTKAPYAEGTLNTQTKTDTLNQINYFRWLAGSGEVTINDKYMEYPGARSSTFINKFRIIT